MKFLAFQFVPLLAAQSGAGEDALSESAQGLVTYYWSRLGQFDEPRNLWLMTAAIGVLALAYVFWMYRRERDSLTPLPRLLLPLLRIIAVAGAILFFLGLERRTDKQEVRDSQVVVLVDTSQSMSVEDESQGEENSLPRLEAVKHALADSPLIAVLREEHHVVLEAFDSKVRRLARLPRLSSNAESEDPEQDAEADSDAEEWQSALTARGVETRLGDAIRNALRRANQGPLAGVVVISDGGQNSGVDPLSIADDGDEFRAPLYSVGVGSTAPRRNLRVQEVAAPSRVYPEDKTTVRGLIQGEGFAGRTIDVELYARDAQVQGSGQRIGREQISFLEDAEVVPVEFDLQPAEVGQLLLELKVLAPSDDQYSGDNKREVELEVVEAQTRVLLIASGPMRDYRFLRDQLRRDRHATVDVLLQSGQPGISQDADHILDEFPTTKDELFVYDCIVAFDPDWLQLDAQQVDLLESWVADEAGGLIVVAGPIHTSAWVQSPEHGPIRALYPVEFQRRLTLMDDGAYGSTTPWPIDFSRDAQESDYLWLGDTPEESSALWAEFEGVFGCYAVKGPKPGARVLGRYSDPDAGLTTEQPVYMAEHFYGGGRVLYLGSGELWRLRNLDISYFEVLYTQMIRHVSQGRLLRGSSRGQLLVERDRYSVGDEVVVRARLSTAGREPLVVDRVTARVTGPDGAGENLNLAADLNRPGNFVGQFDVRQEGSYRIELAVPDSPDELLVQRIQALVPNLEFEKTRRDETLLAALAQRTGGRYYSRLTTAVEGSADVPTLASQIESRAEVKTIRGTPDREFTQRVNQVLLAVICGALCCEWLMRRLLRLA